MIKGGRVKTLAIGNETCERTDLPTAVLRLIVIVRSTAYTSFLYQARISPRASLRNAYSKPNVVLKYKIHVESDQNML